MVSVAIITTNGQDQWDGKAEFASLLRYQIFDLLRMIRDRIQLMMANRSSA